MAKFLDGPGVQASFTDLIKNTDRELFIISPYLKISQMMKNYLTSLDRKKIPISIIYRSDFNLNDDDKKFLNDLANLKLYYCDNLHTKCFINESMGIISTMNLHEHSQTHNWEMGVRFSRKDDPELYSDVTKELRLMGPHLRLQSVSKVAAEPAAKKHEPKLAHKPTEAPNKSTLLKILDIVTGEEGYCIRCGTGLKKYDLQHPYCDKCYASWARYKNPKYKEKYCHACGQAEPNHPTSYEKPVCKHCFTKLYKK